jgi:5-methylcytosine-specific restriction endonuclease McrA
MPSYNCSDGTRVDKKVINRKVRESKALLLQLQKDKYGYNFCEKCKRNDCLPLDCAHIISVSDCQKQGRSEVAWSVTNMQVLCRKCHQEFDKLNIQSVRLEPEGVTVMYVPFH